MRSFDLPFLVLAGAMALSSPFWIPIVVGAYKLGGGVISRRMLLALFGLEACAITFMVWVLWRLE